MDILTQGLLGATVAQSGSRQAETKLATGVGFFAGMLADADVLIFNPDDPLLTIEYHRHFTHALLFIPLGALLAALLLWPLLKKRVKFRTLYVYSLLGYLFSGVLDALTSFGTYLYWPFSNERVAWHLVSIVDPVFTLILLVAVIAGIKMRSNRVARSALVACAAYLLLAAFQLERVETHVLQLAQQRGHQLEQLVVKPTLGNNILWRATYMSDEVIYVDALRAGLGEVQHYPGASIKRISQAELEQLFNKQSVIYQDIQRFRYFSDNYIAWHPGQPDVIGDLRYALLPDSIKPLWGIKIDQDQVEQHARFVTFRKNDKATRQRFLDMLLGRDITALK